MRNGRRRGDTTLFLLKGEDAFQAGEKAAVTFGPALPGAVLKEKATAAYSSLFEQGAFNAGYIEAAAQRNTSAGTALNAGKIRDHADPSDPFVLRQSFKSGRYSFLANRTERSSADWVRGAAKHRARALMMGYYFARMLHQECNGEKGAAEVWRRLSRRRPG